MSDLNEKRKVHGEKERAQIGFFIKKQKEKQVRFNQMEATERILDFQYQTDYSFLFELFVNWSKKAKSEKQKDVLNKSIFALMRMQSYCSTLQTVSKSAVVSLNDEKRLSTNMASKIHDLEKEISDLKKQVEYYEQ